MGGSRARAEAKAFCRSGSTSLKKKAQATPEEERDCLFRWISSLCGQCSLTLGSRIYDIKAKQRSSRLMANVFVVQTLSVGWTHMEILKRTKFKKEMQ